MTIFELYKRFMSINYWEISDEESQEYIKKFIGLKATIVPQMKKTGNLIDRKKYRNRNQVADYAEINSCILDRFLYQPCPSWVREGISERAMREFNIKYFIKENQVIIPHYDLYDRLIGIRCRELDFDKAESYGKYHPLNFQNQVYSHRLSQNLYGLNKNKDTIQRTRKAIVVEGEKSVLLDRSFSRENNIVVACCGHQISVYQINLLTKILGVSEITIAFDKEYKVWKDNDAIKDRKLLNGICEKYHNYASFSYIWDYDNLLDRKDSPFDKGKDVWLELYKNRVKVK